MDLKVELKKVTKKYHLGGSMVHALRGVDLSLKGGELVAITGPSGSGKTTLLNMMGALDKPTSGLVILDDQDISRWPERKRSKLRLTKIGFVFQQFHLIPSMTAFQNVHLPLSESHPFSAQGRKRAHELLELVGLGGKALRLPFQLSGGEQQRVAIARALANDPSLILADEPTGELDSETSQGIMDIIRDLNRSSGKTIVVVTHDPEISKRARRSLKMKDGRILK